MLGHDITDFRTLVDAIEETRQQSREEISCDDDTGPIASRLAQLWKQAEVLTKLYLNGGRRHKDRVRLKRLFQTLREHQQQLQSDHWKTLCDKLGRKPGLRERLGIFRSMLGRKKGTPPISTLFLKDDPESVEDVVIHTFFPHARTTPGKPLPRIVIPQPFEELEQPLTMGELIAALKQGKPRSALGMTASRGRNSATYQNTP
ncbi:hypothetical protein HPB47_015816 [Ixodes persulcatus]|uniref:Uncharacterized protein n=1 Tax=Ixodes persulcatus TaxID=34615 RepID=A0AC60QTQ0_IXOPE|nr:hypothetical protein HPB47_015816 [Ixodes persulcatus]